MKTLWSIVTVMAVANLLALGGFVGWLGGTGRIDESRLRELRELFAPTVADAAAARAAAELEAGQEADQARRQERLTNPPLTASAILASREIAADAAAQEVLRVRQEVRERQAELQLEAERLSEERAAFIAERDAWQSRRDAERQRVAGEQFTQLVALFSTLKPREARDLILEMEARGERADVVRLLDALEVRAAAKIVSELRTPEQRRLASELLARLRDLGQDLPADGSPQESSADVDPLQPADG
jgi:hypothetical protein